MDTKKNVAVIYGGDSSEHDISVKSGKHVASSIDKGKYNVYEILQKGPSWTLQGHGNPVEVDKSDFSVSLGGEKIRFDLAYIINTCSSFVSAVTFDKYACKSYLRKSGVRMANDILINPGDEWDVPTIFEELGGLPLFVKPTDGGSSFGVTKVKDIHGLKKAVEDAFKEGRRVMVEQFIPGREMTDGVYMDEGEIVALPVTEIITDREFFDYEAKYLGESQEVCPAEIPDQMRVSIQEMSKKIYKFLGCNGLVRIDYIVNEKGIYFLEMNTVPGMTEMSLVPKQAAVAGMGLEEFFNILIDNSVC